MPFASSDAPLSPGVMIAPGSVVVKPRRSSLWNLFLSFIGAMILFIAIGWYTLATTTFEPGAERASVLLLAGVGLFVAALVGVNCLDVLFGEYRLRSDVMSLHYEHRIAGVLVSRLDTPAIAAWEFQLVRSTTAWWLTGWCLTRSDSNRVTRIFGTHVQLTSLDIERIVEALRAPRIPVVSRVEQAHQPDAQ